MKTGKKFDTVLIANRSEIACRIIAACKSLGLKTVAVYSEADTGARHTKLADQSICIGPGPANESYLQIQKIIDAAKKTGAGAIHPGYGFLSERAEFAKAVVEAGLIWIGPPAKVIDLMGNKIAAKKAAEAAKVPTLPWALLKDGWSPKDLEAAGAKVGFPLLLKAAAGGGGRGMRLVENPARLQESAESAMREAQGAFGSGEIFLELYCPTARHIEVQIFGDNAGTIVAFGERDCSAQRRHQKVVEEAPAPNLSEATRKALWEAGVRLAKNVGYTNAGTCEFLVDLKENFYFLEMNTRLQVEHPVTELVWGIDLPALQLRIALGEKIPDEVLTAKPRGHAIEVRLYAEDPSKNFMPSPGKIEEFKFPTIPHFRVDYGYVSGSEVPLFYDAMLAKVIAWGLTRESARHTLLDGLSSTNVAGVAWNGFYLVDILRHPRFVDGKIDTQFLGREMGTWSGVVRSAPTSATLGAVEDEELSLMSGKGRFPSPWEVFGDGSGKVGTRSARSKSSAHLHDVDPRSLPEDGPLTSEYPGKVIKVLVKAGDAVEQGQVVAVCESMKMEYSYSAPKANRVKSVKVSVGQVIPAGTVLIHWEDEGA